MQAKQLQRVISRVAVVTSFMICALVSNGSAASHGLQSIKSSSQDMLQFLDNNSTSPTGFETKTIKLGLKDDEQELFSREMYRKKKRKKAAPTVTDAKSFVMDESDAADKSPLSISKGDYSLTFGGATKIEHYFQRNMSYLNRNLPDENEYFKNTFDFTTNFAYGQNRFNHKAIEAYLDIMHKGVWGKNGLVADSEPTVPTKLKLSDTFFGEHIHQNGRPFVWIRDAWLKLSLNAVANAKTDTVHYVQVGWFPFVLGRGISLGFAYGLNRSTLGLYSYPEEKSTPGINVTGELVKDRLSYDLYWSRFEERNKDLRSTTEVIRDFYTPTPKYTWRGLGKDNDIVAARLKIKPVKNENGMIELEPYVMYNTAPDQKLDIAQDSDTKLGTFGLALEQNYKNFEWGGELAGNFGKTTVFAIDKNSTEIYRDANGKLGERYTNIVQYDAAAANGRSAIKVDRSAAVNGVASQLTYQNPNAHVAVPGAGYDIISATDRFRQGYENKFGGWMGVVDAAYNFKDHKVKLAVAGGYASGDKDPDMEQTSKTYKGFVGLNELYTGKRVVSVIMLDERKLQKPVLLGVDPVTRRVQDAAADVSFTDLVFGGASATWTPRVFGKQCHINPNGILFWKAYEEYKPNIDQATGDATLTDQKASKFMGTEINLLSRVELLKDFNLFANLAVLVPGQFFKDYSGVQIEGKDFDRAVTLDVNQAPDKRLYRLAANQAFHVNVGMSYKF